MKKMFFVLSMLLASSTFAIETVTPWTGACRGEECNLTREASIDLLALRGGVDHDLRICKIELNHDCPECPTDDSIKILGAGGSLLATLLNGQSKAFGPNDAQPTKAILFLNSVRKGQTFAITFCSTVKRVVVGSMWSNAAVNFSGGLQVTAGALTNFNLPFNGGVHIDGLRYKVEKKCGSDTVFTNINPQNPILSLVQGQTQLSLPSIHLPALVSTNAGTFGADGNNEAWKCFEGQCQFKVTFGEFDRCFRLLDDLCANGDCKPTAMKLNVKARLNAELTCLDNCDTN